MHDTLKEILGRNMAKIAEVFDPTDEFWNHLMSARPLVITRPQKQKIVRMTSYEQVAHIIDALERRPDKDYRTFCDALTASNQQLVVETFLKDGLTFLDEMRGGDQADSEAIPNAHNLR